MRYVHQYLDLNDEQDAAFRANLVVTIEAYRKDGLDDIIRTLAVAQAYAADGAPCVRVVVAFNEAVKDESKIHSVVQTASG